MEYTLTSNISRSDAVARIAARTSLPDDREREAKNRVSKRIGYAVRQGKLIESPRGFFPFGELSTWVRSTWPGLFNDWPHATSADLVSAARCSSIFDSVVLPGSIDRCHDVIVEMNEKVRSLEERLTAAQLEIEQLRPGAEQWRKFCAKNKGSAKKPRK